MPLKFRLVTRDVLVKGQKEKRQIAQTVYSGSSDLDRLSRLIGQISALSEGDVKSVLDTMSRLVARDLIDGRLVSLGDLGRLRLTVRAQAPKADGEFLTRMIRKPGIVFSPGQLIRSELRDVKFMRVDTPTKPAAPNGGSAPSEPGDNGGGLGA
ncbi:DNA-binding protein, histone-like family [Porphyromonas crevioricanis JCM 15906]|uniref:DNA-binding protein, histone-like family n=2 Tax=Porphyromonas crevioricanis TaxID=393921 RepID=T1CRH2_9PORP|nr:HU family DNA-binding protein [Porphyromonas crevioricanis]GAD05683.1 DNA-binding protein, histone-like family [Porphyromonas crevioricanis JCM 15906]GAD06569.1 DNA-binding protein, histone-like family [Porphyromonas crevioricanis JCM 13913]SJZ60919.1 DNA-binding protein, histone-like, putative [Porphyromonas crevioricanis]SQH72800.1 putative DNA-binding protein [Porphyromonas crevioricanis]